jgi:WD40 repeat protein
VRIWDAASGEQLGAPLTGHTSSVRAVALGRIGEREIIVSGSGDTTVRIWDAASRKQLDALIGHFSSVRAVALWRVRGRQVIVSGSKDRTVRIWDHLRHSSTVLDMLEPVSGVAVSSDCLCVATGIAICVFELGHQAVAEE